MEKTKITKTHFYFEYENHRYSVPLIELSKDDDIRREYDLYDTNKAFADDSADRQLFEMVNGEEDDMGYLLKTTIIFKPNLYKRFIVEEKTAFGGWRNIKDDNDYFKRMTRNAGPRD